MASSRWKRFAFFERQNLAIPDAVWNDLTSDIRSSSSHAKSVGAASAANAVIVTTTPPSPTTTTSVSLTVSTAALPAHTKPVGPKPPASPTAESSSVDAIAAMWSSLTACSPAFTNADDAPSYHAASATGTVVVGTSAVVQLPSQGQQALASSSSVVAACASSTTTTTTTTVLDGLVLAFAASPGCSRIHCLDVTVRCNPPGVVPPRKQAAAVTAPSEDMDGWRGYWSPFRTTPPPQPIETSAGSQNRSGGVVAVATCRVPAFSTNKDNGRPQQTPPHQQHRAAVHSPLHVACLGSQNQLVVWEDPHLHLSCRQPVQDTAISTTSNGIPTDVVVYQVQQQQLSSGSSNIKWWNTANDGSACVLDICPGMVAVGTDIGVVLVYAYHTTITVRPTVKQQHQQQQQRVLRPYLRIPPPPVTGMQVISVRLSASTDNTNKASIFVAYNRQVNSPSTSSVSVNAATATTTAGICCYDLPLPSNHQQQVLSAPSARYDLDGRYVGSSSLVDAYPRRQGGGLILTVVRAAACLNSEAATIFSLL